MRVYNAERGDSRPPSVFPTHHCTMTVLQALERMENHLTAAIVSNDVMFQQQVRQPSQPINKALKPT